MKLRYTVVMLFALLTACASVGLPTADTTNQRLAVGYGTVTEIRTSAATLLKAGKMTKADGQNVLGLTDQARTALELAESMAKTDLPGANTKLQMATSILSGLRTYLATKQKE